MLRTITIRSAQSLIFIILSPLDKGLVFHYYFRAKFSRKNRADCATLSKAKLIRHQMFVEGEKGSGWGNRGLFANTWLQHKLDPDLMFLEVGKFPVGCPMGSPVFSIKFIIAASIACIFRSTTQSCPRKPRKMKNFDSPLDCPTTR